jgi:hypothetical protein
MKLIIFITMLCGQPDIIAFHEEGKKSYFYYGNDILIDPVIKQDFLSQISREDKSVLYIPDQRGTCT